MQALTTTVIILFVYFPLQEGLCYDKISPDAKVMQLKGFSDFDPSWRAARVDLHLKEDSLMGVEWGGGFKSYYR